MGFIKEFKDFAMRGNLMDMAVAVVIGAAFGKVVSAFIDGIIMPLVGIITGGVNFDTLTYVTGSGVVIKYGGFITQVVDFLVVALVVFMVIKGMNRMKKKQEAAPAAPAAPTKDQELLSEIRDLLKNK